MSADVVVRAPAKINLFLRVLAREDSGYHQIETLFQALELHDTIRVDRRSEPGVTLEVTGSFPVPDGETEEGIEDDLGPEEENLAYRAAVAYRERAGLAGEPGVRIRLQKAIPAGSGMGGGSSDAAAVLRALDAFHPGALEPSALMSVATGIGSDVPFFLGPDPLALAWGRGERLLGLPSLDPRPVVLVVPDYRISTAEAYGKLARRRAGSGPSRTGAGRARTEGSAGPADVPGVDRIAPSAPYTLPDLSSWEGVRARAENDFEPIAYEEHPEGRKILDALVSAGGSPTLLSGSGSALFGVFEAAGAADEAAHHVAVHFPEARVLRTATLTAWHPIVTS